MDEFLSWACSVLMTTPQRWESLCQSIPEKLLARPPAEGEWSARECLEHCMDTEGLFQSRVEAFLAGSDFPAFDPERQGSQGWSAQPADELAKRFGQMREKSLAMIGKLSGEDMKRRVRHAELGEVSLGEMMNEWAGHDLMHLVQAERALMQPFIHGCGPWNVYFHEHVISG